MEGNQRKLQELLQQLADVQQRQQSFSKEIEELAVAITKLNSETHLSVDIEGDSVPQIPLTNPIQPIVADLPKEKVETTSPPKQTFRIKAEPPSNRTNAFNLEKFIGENLISKIGIIILILGVVFGTKYSIEHQLVSPTTRLFMGYLTGVALLFAGMRLKEKYLNYSAVLVSGAMTILYFITYVGYDLYHLIPQTPAFLMMVVFTAFTVFAAIKFDRQIIGVLGLVGAYGVPFLLSSGSGRYDILFSYIALVNVGVLAVSVQRYWRTMYHSALFLTWVIYAIWCFATYDKSTQFGMAAFFLVTYFLLFYATFLSYKLLKKQPFRMTNIFVVLLNAFIFYALGYYLIDHLNYGSRYLGLFTVATALLHFMAASVVFYYKLADRNLFYLLAGLVLLFITIAVPVQLNGNWVTLLWIGEALILFWVGRSNRIHAYEKLSYPLILLAVGSLVQDWSGSYESYFKLNPSSWVNTFWNPVFFSGILSSAALGFMTYLNYKEREFAPTFKRITHNLFVIAIPAIFIFTLYGTFFVEIATYWDQQYTNSGIEFSVDSNFRNTLYNTDILHFSTTWLLNYSLLFFVLVSIFNMYFIKNKNVGMANLVLNGIACLAFLAGGLFAISELRESYLNQGEVEYFVHGQYNLIFRYISLAFMLSMMVVIHLYLRKAFLEFKNWVLADIFLHTVILWILSSELLHWMDIADSSQMYKLGLSILWGVYSSLLVGFGIWKGKQHLRFIAIFLFAVTLVKLFVYDIAHLNTISKTIVFVSLGALLLIISYLYNKFKHLMIDEQKS